GRQRPEPRANDPRRSLPAGRQRHDSAGRAKAGAKHALGLHPTSGYRRKSWPPPRHLGPLLRTGKEAERWTRVGRDGHRTDQRTRDGSIYHPARRAVVHGESAGLVPGDAALSRLAQPFGLPFYLAAARSEIYGG